MSAPGSITADGARGLATHRAPGAVELVEPPREAVEWMASPAPATDLWWTATVCGEEDPGWHRLESAAQIADLVNALTDPRDKLILEDEPPTRYAQIMLLGDGLFMVEIAKRFEGLGAYNWRIGRGRAADEAANDPPGPRPAPAGAHRRRDHRGPRQLGTGPWSPTALRGGPAHLRQPAGPGARVRLVTL